MMEVYLDNSATTKCFDEVAVLMTRIMCEDYGNSSSLHRKGVQAENYIRYAKEVLSKNLKVKDKEIFFTSGGTEADNLAVIGGAHANCRAGKHLITTQVEHPAVIQSMKQLEEEGFRVTYLPVDSKGCIDPADLERAITGETILVSIMHTNNEVGSLQPIAEAGALIKRMNPRIVFHVDAVQGYGKFRIYPKKINIDLLSASGHKIHGPKGVGFLYADEKVKLKPISYGGGQQNGLRSGTINVPGIAGMARAVELLYENFDQDIAKIVHMKKVFIEGIQKMEDVIINGHLDECGAPHVVSVSFRGLRSEVILHSLEDKGIYVSAGSACSAHKAQPSATLRAIGLEKELLDATIRFSFSVLNTIDEINYTLQTMYDIIPMLRKYTRK